ncbi:MAG: hypothetical protein OEW75_02870, partial [Cyclobacteriaceae bacterium]|nr:hypothetical protein [Cyclobacteriaceae bacterium]
TEFPPALSAHDIGLKDLVEGLIIRDKLPEICLITISINEIQPMTVGLTDEVKKSFPKVFEEVKNVIEGWKVEMKI